MKKEYDFSRGKRGAAIQTKPGKTRITIRIDNEVLHWFKNQTDEAGGGSYQTLINNALRRFIDLQDRQLEEVLRRILREELPRYGSRVAARPSRKPKRSA